MRTKPKAQSIIFTVIGSATMLLLAAPAFATSIPGYSGKSVGPYPQGKNAAESCLNEVNGGVANNCNSQQLYEIPVPATSGNQATVWLSAYNYSGTFQCTLYAAGEFGGPLVPGTTINPPAGYSNLPMYVTPPTWSGPGGTGIGAMYVYCQFGPGSAIWNVQY
jgi:hypothetical protein